MTDPSSPVVSDTRRIRLRRIKAGSLFKLILIPTAFFFIPFVLLGLVCGVCAFFGVENVMRVDGQSVTGIKGLIAGLLVGPLSVLLYSLPFWGSLYIGLRIFGYFRPITLDYVPTKEDN